MTQLILLVRSRAQVLLFLAAIVIGLASGLAATAFRALEGAVQELFFGYGGERLASHLESLHWAHILLAPALGGLLIALFTYYCLPNRKPQGVAHVIEATALHGGRMSLWDGLRVAFASAASLGVGASTGREGPVVHLGASISSWMAQRLKMDYAMTRTLLGCGVAGAIAASFNAPLAGVFFALEVVIGNYALTAFAPVVVASVIGTLVTRLTYGDYPAFILPDVIEIASFWEFPAFALLGVTSALAAICFMSSIMKADDLLKAVPVPFWLKTSLGGLGLGALALVFPQILGVGYEATDQALNGSYGLWIMIALIGVKTLATALSLGSGFSGGVFSPSLFVGAMVGGAFGLVATYAFPELSSGHNAYTIVGMGAVAGAVLGAPISTVLMIFELTNNYEIMIAVMVATAISSLITQQVHKRSFFLWQLERRGVSIDKGRENSLLRETTVGRLLKEDFCTLRPDACLSDVRNTLGQCRYGQVFVTCEDNCLKGRISYADLERIRQEHQTNDWATLAGLSAQDVMSEVPVRLFREDSLNDAIQAHDIHGEVHIPVVDHAAEPRLLGILHEHDVLLAYRSTLERIRAEERGH
ncbi:chloride channel protein [Kiloniella sp. b19]|uniref:chloride channel protein n=1 Tax=Kiloniella sp. GXU_MW_B19 TaxID=3141326 RepID=UPI0031D3408B